MSKKVTTKPSEVMRDERHEKAAEMMAKGLSLQKIADVCGVNISTTKEWFSDKCMQATPVAIRARERYIRAQGAKSAGLSVASLLLDHVRLVREAAENNQFKAAIDGNWKLIEYLRANPDAATIDTEGETVNDDKSKIKMLMEGDGDHDE